VLKKGETDYGFLNCLFAKLDKRVSTIYEGATCTLQKKTYFAS